MEKSGNPSQRFPNGEICETMLAEVIPDKIRGGISKGIPGNLFGYSEKLSR